MSLYKKIIKQAWFISWRYKFLWLFGLFAAALAVSGNYEILAQIIKTATGESETTFWGLNQLWREGIIQAFSFSNLKILALNQPLDLLLVLMTILIFLIIITIIVWLIICSVSALIYGIYKIHKKEKFTWGEVWQVAVNNFWNVFKVFLLAKLLVLLLFFAASVPLYFLMWQNSLLNIIFYLLLFIIASLLAIIINFLAIYAAIYIIGNKQTFSRAALAAYRLFINNWLVSLEMAFLLLLIKIIAALLFAIILIILTIPYTLLIFAFAYLTVEWGLIIIPPLIVFTFFVLFLLFGAWITVFQFSAWLLLFEQIQNKFKSKLERTYSTLTNYFTNKKIRN